MIVTALLLSMAPPQAKPSPNESDLRCVAAISMIVGSLPPEKRPEASSGVMFYYGRILGRTPGYDLQVNLKRLLGTIDQPEKLRPDLVRCGGELQRRGAYLSQMGKALQSAPAK